MQVLLYLLPAFSFMLLSVNLLFVIQGQQGIPLHLSQLLLQITPLLCSLGKLMFSIHTHPSSIPWTDVSNLYQNPTQLLDGDNRDQQNFIYSFIYRGYSSMSLCGTC